jgi:acyl carrier protein
MEISIFLQKFLEILDDNDKTLLNADSSFRDLVEWNSLTALSLIAMVDEIYGVRLTGEDIRTSITLTDIFDKITSKS